MKINNVEHLWTIACRSSSVDQQTNLLSMFDILEEFNVDIQLEKETEVLNIPFQLELVSLWRKFNNKEENLEIEIEFIDPNRKRLAILSYPLNLPADKKRMRNKLAINGIAVTISGTYVFAIKVKNQDTSKFVEVEEVSIEIIVNKRLINQKPKTVS